MEVTHMPFFSISYKQQQHGGRANLCRGNDTNVPYIQILKWREKILEKKKGKFVEKSFFKFKITRWLQCKICL